jgi:hypothetical protein
VQTVNFVHRASFDTDEEQFALSYEVLYDGFSFNTTVDSEVDYNISGSGSPRAVGSPVVSGSPLGSPTPADVAGSPFGFTVAVAEVTNGGEIYKSKAAALSAFGDLLA